MHLTQDEGPGWDFGVVSLGGQEYILTMNEKENMTLRAHSGKA